MLSQNTGQMVAELFASSLLEIIPNTRFYEITGKRLGFICEFSTPFPLSLDYIKIVEERMREKIKQGSGAVRIFEMTSKNAVEFLKSRKQLMRAKKIVRTEPLVTMIQMGEYVNCLDRDVDTDLSKIGAFFLEFEGQENFSKIRGFCFSDKSAMKEYNQRKRVALDHLKIGQEKGFFEIDEGITWLHEGLQVRDAVTAVLSILLTQSGFQRVHIPLSHEHSLGNKNFEIVEREGELEGEFGLKDRFSHLCIRVFSENQTYLLQLREELSKISPFNSFIVTDPIGLNWEVITQDGSELIIWIDRWIALMWEKGL